MPFKVGKTWYATVSDKQLPGGRLKKKAGTLKKEAEVLEAEIRVQLAAGTYTIEEDRPPLVVAVDSFKDFVVENFLPWSELHHAESHHERLTGIITRHLLPRFGKMDLSKISRADVIAYGLDRRKSTHRKKGWKKAKPVSPATVNREIACLGAIFGMALALDIIEASPTTRIKQFKEEKRAPELLTKKQVKALLAAVPEHYRAMLGVAVYAGLRASEIFQLEWKDIDFDNLMLTVTPSDAQDVKTGKFRNIPIDRDEALRLLLIEHRRLSSAKFSNRLVFPNAQGQQYTTLNKILDKAAKQIGLERVRMHQLRHNADFRIMPTKALRFVYASS